MTEVQDVGPPDIRRLVSFGPEGVGCIDDGEAGNHRPVATDAGLTEFDKREPVFEAVPGADRAVVVRPAYRSARGFSAGLPRLQLLFWSLCLLTIGIIDNLNGFQNRESISTRII